MVREDEKPHVIFDKKKLREFIEKVGRILPNAVGFLMTLEPFDFGSRPDELRGRTSMNAVERTDVDGDIYFGEVSTYDSDIFCGKGILAGVTAANPYIAVGWFRNRLLSGKGRCIIEASQAIYEGEFYNFKYHGKGKMTE